MLNRHALLGLALAAAGTALTGPGLLAGEEQPTTLHGARGTTVRDVVVVRHGPDRAIVRRDAMLRRVDRLMADAADVAELARPQRRVEVRVHHSGYLRGAERSRGESTLHGTHGRHRPDPYARQRELESRIAEMQVQLAEMHHRLERAPRYDEPRHDHGRTVIITIEDVPFRRFLSSLDRTPFADDKVALVRDTARHAYFTSDQAAVIVRRIQPWGQVDTAATLHPRVVDPESFHTVYGALRFSSDSQELRKRLDRARTSPGRHRD